MISVLLGACRLDGAPISPERFDAIDRRAVVPDRAWRSERWRALRGGVAASMPLTTNGVALVVGESEDGDRGLVWNGTLFNREELTRELARVTELPESPHDAQVALAAYGAWGVGFPERLLGEFALILWDDPRQRLVAARDAMGLRDLFYRPGAQGVAVASQTALLQPPAGPSLDDLDEEYLADFLATHLVAGNRTPFRSIRRLPSSHVLVAERGQIRVEPYWQPSGARSIRYAREEEYAEGLRHLLFDAVTRCLDPSRRVWSELSGGLDSSSIAAVAHRVLTEEPARDQGFGLLSRVWDESPDVDEREWSAPVAEAIGRPWHQVRCDGLAFDGASEGARFYDDPGFPLLLYPTHRAYAGRLREHGVSALLSGARAEAVLLPEGPPPLHLADLLQRLELRRLGTELVAWQKTLHEPFANILWRSCLAPVLNPRRNFHLLDSNFRAPDWLSRDFVRRMRVDRRTRLGRMPRRFRLPTAQYQYEILGSSEPLVQRGYVPLNCEILHPFMYRPLVEYCFAVPWEEKVRPGVHKWLLRRALVGVLPEKVRRRGNKYGPGPHIYRTLPLHWHRLAPLVRDPVLAELGILDRDAFRRAGDLARLGTSKRFAIFLGALALEVWVRAIFQRDEPLRATA